MRGAEAAPVRRHIRPGPPSPPKSPAAGRRQIRARGGRQVRADVDAIVVCQHRSKERRYGMLIWSASFSATARLGIPAGVFLVVAGCSTSGTAEATSSGTHSAGHGTLCKSSDGFELSLASSTGGELTPVAAAMWFAAHGGIPSVPQQGWQVVDRNRHGATLRAGVNQLHAVQGSDGTWQVNSGTTCK